MIKKTVNQLIKQTLLLLVIVGFSFNGMANEGEESKFNAGAMIMHHIADAHEIHMIGDFAIYLPVILKTEEGIKVFSSSNFYHNEITIHTHKGDEHAYIHEGFVMFHEKIYYKNSEASLNLDEHGHPTNLAPLDLSITKSDAGLLFIMVILLLVFSRVAKGYKTRGSLSAPKGIQSFLEPLIIFVRDDLAVPSIGKKHAERFTPFLLTVFFFIWFCNMLGLIPFLGGFNITGTLSVTLVLAVIVFFIVNMNGNKHYWGHLLSPPGVPFGIKLILVPIEILGIFIKPVVLMVRLTANITAGHIIILSFLCLIFIFGEQSAVAGYGVGIGSTLFMIFMYVIELLVAFLQAYVFTLLTALYIGSAVEEVEHH